MLFRSLYQGFADRYLPDARAPVDTGVDLATAKAHAGLLAGAYRTSRREDSTFLSILQLVSPVRVEVAGQGRVALELGGSRSEFREIRPFLWQEVNGKRRLQALVENGKVTRWGLEPYVFAFVFEPVPFMASGPVLVLLLGALGVALATALAWPVAAHVRRRHALAPPVRTLAWVRVACCLVLASAALWVLTFVLIEDSDPGLVLVLAQATSWLAFGGGLLAALWHARTVAAAGARHALGLPLLWVLCFALLVAVGLYHHLLSFNSHF